jgi:hypothetical protein
MKFRNFYLFLSAGIQIWIANPNLDPISLIIVKFLVPGSEREETYG